MIGLIVAAVLLAVPIAATAQQQSWWHVCIVTPDGVDPARCRRKIDLPWKDPPQISAKVACPEDYKLVAVMSDEKVICAKEMAAP